MHNLEVIWNVINGFTSANQGNNQKVGNVNRNYSNI